VGARLLAYVEDIAAIYSRYGEKIRTVRVAAGRSRGQDNRCGRERGQQWASHVNSVSEWYRSDLYSVLLKHTPAVKQMGLVAE
jgi:hypothetical protein